MTQYITLNEHQQKLAVKSLAESGEIYFKNYGKVTFRKHKARKGILNSHLHGEISKEVDYIQGNWSTSRSLKEILKKLIKQ